MCSGQYTSTAVLLHPNQESKIVKAVKHGRGCKIHITKCASDESSPMVSSQDLSGHKSAKGILHLTTPQAVKYADAENGSHMNLHFSSRQLSENATHLRGGFIPLLIGLLAPLIGTMAGEAIGKKISGGSITPNHSVFLCKGTEKRNTMLATPHGSGLHLSPWRGDPPSGTGLYLRQYRGKGMRPVSAGELPTNFKKMHRTILNNIL